MQEGFSGNLAKAFMTSKITVLLMVAFLLIGTYSTFLIPREEEPQIEVPIADIFIRYQGAAPDEMESKVIAPLERVVSNIKGVEYVYSTSMQGQGMLIVQFYVGEDIERSLVKLYNEIMKNMDKMPQGVSFPLIKSRAIDDVPVLGLTLWSEQSGDYALRQVGEVLTKELKKIPDIADVKILGGRNRVLNITLDKDKLAENKLDFAMVSRFIGGNNMRGESGNLRQNNESIPVETGSFFTTAEEVGNLIVGNNQGYPVYLRQVATLEEGPSAPSQYVSFGYGNADKEKRTSFSSSYPAVTLAIAKKKGADAMQLSEQVLEKVSHLKNDLLSEDMHLETTRNYGETASEKVSELLLHLLVAIVVVTLFVMLAMGWRGGLVVFLSVPVTFALTLFSYYLMDYTLNRITLFALVFITGIVVDDSIIIAENMHRHFKLRKLSFIDAAIFSINEVGNPTILATFTVIAAVLPMAFVSGLMGPYMSPMPIGASIAMLLSLAVALTVTPYLGYLFLREKEEKGHGEHATEQTKIYKLYHAFIAPMLESRWKRWAFMLGTIVVLMASMVLFYTKSVAVKMLPFDNKNEFQVVIDLPEGSTLEKTAAVTQEIADYVATQPKVLNYQTYTGTAGPISFNGLVRHYDLRGSENAADIQVNFIDKKERSEQSHELVKGMRDSIQAIAKKYKANVKLVEIPPGPPVLSTLVAEIYGPDYQQQLNIAAQVKSIFAETPGVVDVDWMAEDDQKEYRVEVDKEKAAFHGLATAQVVDAVNAVLSDRNVGVLHDPVAYEQIPMYLKVMDVDKSNIADLKTIKVINAQGMPVGLGDVTTVSEVMKPKSIYRKNQKRVVYVLADMAGTLESPSYAMSDISERLHLVQVPKGYQLKEEYTAQPELEDQFSLKWDGEWQITFEVFRDLGVAFLVAIIIIYMLIVGWFQNFTVPLLMLVAVPLSMIGIVLGHWMMDAYFTATSMIGFIALAGVMVRNSILLVDFVNIRLEEGIPLKQAIIEAGAVRTTPILLTAGAVALGAVVILFDPIFQGLAISLMGGTLTSTFLTLLVVPLLYYRMMRGKTK